MYAYLKIHTCVNFSNKNVNSERALLNLNANKKHSAPLICTSHASNNFKLAFAIHLG